MNELPHIYSRLLAVCTSARRRPTFLNGTLPGLFFLDLDNELLAFFKTVTATALLEVGSLNFLQRQKAVAFRAAQHVQDFLPIAKRDILKFEGCTQAWGRALSDAGITLSDLSFVETHDCFTIAELIEYEAMGLVPEGQGARAIKDGITAKDGKLPINPSGGLKSKGHPIGATGVSMHALSAMQLTNTAGGIQVDGAKLAGIFNMGGAAVANYVSVLERIK